MIITWDYIITQHTNNDKDIRSCSSLNSCHWWHWELDYHVIIRPTHTHTHTCTHTRTHTKTSKHTYIHTPHTHAQTPPPTHTNTHKQAQPHTRTHTHTHLVRLVVQDDKISVADVEPRQVFTGIFGIENVFVNDKRSTFCVRCIAPVGWKGLTNGHTHTQSHIHSLMHIHTCTCTHTHTYNLICLIAPNLPNISYISSGEISKGKFL